uniref:nitrilase-related carbon-nitrogen hydrolase n=1 Tax=Enterobacter cloacae complex sp. TaxID=2027919 RepID=UPI003B63B46B
MRVAAVQAEPAFLDLDATTELACELIRQASEKGADLIAFPEAFVPSFPNWYESSGKDRCHASSINDCSCSRLKCPAPTSMRLPKPAAVAPSMP